MTHPADAATPERPTCLACNHHAPRALLCTACLRRLTGLLAAIPAGHARLDPAPGAAGPSGGRGAPGYGSRPPARVDVLSLLVAPGHAVTSRPLVVDEPDERADPDTPENAPGHAPLVVAVGRWADRAREDGLLPGLAGPRTVAGECLRLSGIVELLAARWWVGDMVRDLAGTAHRLRAALGEPDAPTVPVGRCPRLVDDTPCDGPVRARLTADTATCARCHHRWRGEDTMRRLGDALGGAMLDLAGLARYLDDDVSVAGLRQWAHRDGWRRERVGRRTVYSLADARASWWARRGPRGVAVDGAERMGA